MKNKTVQTGQALIMVILIGMIALIAVVSSTTLVVGELKKNTIATVGIAQYHVTYGALENAFIRLLRDPNYSGETLTLSPSTCYITVAGASTKTVVARCTDGTYVRKIQATVTFSSAIMSVSAISEIP